MELHQLRYFVAAAEAGSISRAAERLAVAQPSVSQQIKRLESTLGAPLFDRFGRGVSLTDAGRALLPRARRILAEVRDVETRLQAEVDTGAVEIGVGAIPTMAPYLLPGAVAALQRALPDARVTLREDLTERLIEALVDNEIDCAVVSTPIEHNLVELEVLGDEPMLVVVPDGHPLAGLDAVSLQALRDLPTVTLHEMHCLGQQIAGFCAAKRLGRRVSCRTTQVATVLEFVRLGMGVSVVPAMAATPLKGLRYLPFRSAPPRRDIALAWRRDRTRAVAAERLGAILRGAVNA